MLQGLIVEGFSSTRYHIHEAGHSDNVECIVTFVGISTFVLVQKLICTKIRVVLDVPHIHDQHVIRCYCLDGMGHFIDQISKSLHVEREFFGQFIWLQRFSVESRFAGRHLLRHEFRRGFTDRVRNELRRRRLNLNQILAHKL